MVGGFWGEVGQRLELRRDAVEPMSALHHALHRDPDKAAINTCGDTIFAMARCQDGGRIAADTVRNLLVVLLTVAVGYVVGFRFSSGAGRAVAMVALAVPAGTAFCSVTAWIGLLLKDVESVQSVVLVLLLTLTFASSLFVPVAGMPRPLRAFAAHQPVSVIADAMRGLALQPVAAGSPAHDVVVSVAWIAGITVVFAPLAVRTYTYSRVR